MFGFLPNFLILSLGIVVLAGLVGVLAAAVVRRENAARAVRRQAPPYAPRPVRRRLLAPVTQVSSVAAAPRAGLRGLAARLPRLRPVRRSARPKVAPPLTVVAAAPCATASHPVRPSPVRPVRPVLSPRPARMPSPAVAGRVHTKTCSQCAQEVRAAARVCKHCGHRFAPPPGAAARLASDVPRTRLVRAA